MFKANKLFAMAAKLEEQTTVVNETTTRVDENVPAVGAPVEPEPQVEEPLPTSDEPAEVEAPVEDPATNEPIVVEGEGDEVVAEDQDGDGDVDTVEVELPEGVTAEDVEETKTEIAEVVSEVEKEGVSPSSMRKLHRYWGDTLKIFGINELPALDTIKKDSINLRAAAQTVNAFNTLSKKLNVFKKKA